VEDAEEHLVTRYGRDEPENADDQEDYTKENCGCFDHLDLLWVKSHAYGRRRWRWQAKTTEELGNKARGRLSKIDNMKVLFGLLLPCVVTALMVDLSPAQDSPVSAAKTAVFAGGCFWCIQPAFDKAPGVIKTLVGYCGGTEPNPTYESVSSEKTGYRESIEVTYNPAKISFDQLLDIYWRQIDPTQADGQFTDIGPSYRAAIFYGDSEEKKIAQASKEKLAKTKKFDKPIVTEILPAAKFYPAEDYHQKYYQQNAEHFEAFEKGSGRVSFQEKMWSKSP
jgi:methionine-S-sulfoxide reductase